MSTLEKIFPTALQSSACPCSRHVCEKCLFAGGACAGCRLAQALLPTTLLLSIFGRLVSWPAFSLLQPLLLYSSHCQHTEDHLSTGKFPTAWLWLAMLRMPMLPTSPIVFPTAASLRQPLICSAMSSTFSGVLSLQQPFHQQPV